MSDLLGVLGNFIWRLLTIIFPGHNNQAARSVYYWIVNNPITLLFALIIFFPLIVNIFRRLIKIL